MLDKRYIDLPKAPFLWGNEIFERVFLDELQQQESVLPLEQMCTEGGWPDDDTLELSIKSMTEDNGKAIVLVECYFNEVVPTGCADIKNSASGYGVVEVVIDLREKRAYIPFDTDDP